MTEPSIAPSAEPSVAPSIAPSAAPSATSVDVPTMAHHWAELVAVAMLGTDRRNPPPAPPLIADLVDDTVRERPSARMLAQVAATVAVRRAGVLPGPSFARLAGPPHDDRPVIAPRAVERWYQVIAEWPVLEDEWLVAVVSGGRRLPPELVPEMLRRHRGDPVRRARALAAAGPIAPWLVDHVPDLAARTPPAVDELVAELPELPIPADLQPLLHAPGQEAARALRSGLETGTLVHAHRAVLVNLIARVRPDALDPIRREMEAIDPNTLAAAVARVLGELAATRRSMLDELSAPG